MSARHIREILISSSRNKNALRLRNSKNLIPT